MSQGSSSLSLQCKLTLTARSIRGLACWDTLIVCFLKKQNTEAFHFIKHDKSLSNSKQSHSVFGVLTCLNVMLYLFEFHWRIVERNYVKCWICYATSFGFLKKWCTPEIICFCLLFAVLMCYDHSSAASRLNMIISIPKKQVFDGRNNTNSQTKSIQLCIHNSSRTVCHSTFVCGLNPGNMLSD